MHCDLDVFAQRSGLKQISAMPPATVTKVVDESHIAWANVLMLVAL